MLIYGLLVLLTLVVAVLVAAYSRKRSECETMRVELSDRHGAVTTLEGQAFELRTQLGEAIERASQPPSYDEWVKRDRHENTVTCLIAEREVWKEKARKNTIEMGAAQERLIGQIESVMAARGIVLNDETKAVLDAQRETLREMNRMLVNIPVTDFVRGEDGVWRPRHEVEAAQAQAASTKTVIVNGERTA